MMKDPVCGMQVDEKNAPTSMVDGKKYAFCSQSCKEEFDANPRQYTSTAEHHAQKDTHKSESHKVRV
jgi:YHS domain-containing protein